MGVLDLQALAATLAARGAPIPRIVVFSIVGSTQDEAASLARSGAPAGTLVIASVQTAGRGRVGRTWHSPRGGLYASLVLRPVATPDRWPALAVLAGTAVAEALSEAGVAALRVKWPNDVLVDGRKVAGLLAEAHLGEGFAVLGLGLNVAFAADLPAEIAGIATDLAWALPTSASRTEACASVLAAVAQACVGASPDLAVDPARASRWLDGTRDVAVAGVRGRPAGVTVLGELVIDAADGTTVRVSMGEVTDAGGH